MDRSSFTKQAPGHLVKIDLPKPDWAFVPNPLISEWDLPPRLWPLLVETREAIGRLDGVGRHMPNHELLLRPLLQREALRSSSMEGTFATPKQLLLYQADPTEATSKDDKKIPWREVFNYSSALIAGKAQLEAGYPLSLQLIRALHAELLNGVRGEEKAPGQFRKRQVLVGVGGRFIPPPGHNLADCLTALENTLQEPTGIDPLVRAFMVHYQFEAVHPFYDGNGRVGRLLLSLQIFKQLKLTHPWLYLSAYFEKHKDDYIDGLFRISTHNDWDSWIEFCLRAAREQANDAIQRFDELVALRDRYHMKAGTLQASARLHPLIDWLFETPLLTVSQVQQRAKVTYPTAKSDLEHLVGLKILKRSADNRPMFYYANKIMSIAFRDDGDTSQTPGEVTQ